MLKLMRTKQELLAELATLNFIARVQESAVRYPFC